MKIYLYIILSLLLNVNLTLANQLTKNSKLESSQLIEIQKILQSLLPFHKRNQADGTNNKNRFTVDKCKIDQSKWMLLLIAKQVFTEKITFNSQCHIEGQYTAKMETPFPVHLKLKNLTNFDQIQFNFLIKLVYDPVPTIKINMQNGKLKGTDNKIHFDLDYAAQIDPLSKNFIKKDLGGKITIRSINTIKVKQVIPFKNMR